MGLSECAEEWWSGADGAWSGSELSPVRDEAAGVVGTAGADEASLRTLSAAIVQRQRSEAERGSLLDRVLAIGTRLHLNRHGLRININ